jgi:catechol 2,3-dioxygenase-like lactoylglutathione lyase family enzyme
LALAQVGAVQMELIEHVDGDSIYKDFLIEHGEGLHHMNFLVDDVDQTVAELGKEGFVSLQNGYFEDGAFNYVDLTKPLRTIWEPVKMPSVDLTAQGTLWPEPGVESLAKVKVKGINQACIVVSDVELVAQNYWNILGIGPWIFLDWKSPLVYDYRYHGKPSWARSKLALAQVGDVQFELVEHIEGESIYKDFLTEHGEGLHHLNFLVDNVDEAVAEFEKEGFYSLQSGRIEGEGAYNYIDLTKPLHAIWEAVKMPTVDLSAQGTTWP